MMLTRGVRVAGSPANAARRPLDSLFARSFSSATRQAGLTRPSTVLSKAGIQISRSRGQLLQLNGLPAMRNGSAIRLKSTSAIPPTTEPIPATGTPSSIPDATPESLSTSIDTLTDMSFVKSATEFGYLKSLGLDFGWGPTSIMQWTLDTVNALGGAPPWWVSIAIATALVRVVLFKPFCDASDNTARNAAIKHLMDPLNEKMSKARASRDMQAIAAVQTEQRRIQKRAGIKLWRSFVPLIQGFLGFGMYRLMNAMSTLPVPGFEEGGFAWITNLTVYDPFYTLPVALAATVWYTMRKGGEMAASTVPQTTQKVMTYFLPGITFAFTMWQPAGLQLAFLFTSLLGAVQSRLLLSERVRSIMGLYPIKAAPKPLEAEPLDHINLSTRALEYHAPRKTTDEPVNKGGIMGSIKDIQGSAKKMFAEANKRVGGDVDGQRSKAQLKRIRDMDEKAELALERKRQEAREFHQFKKMQKAHDKKLWDLSEEALEQRRAEIAAKNKKKVQRTK